MCIYFFFILGLNYDLGIFVRYYNITYGYSSITKLLLAVHLMKCVKEGLVIISGG